MQCVFIFTQKNHRQQPEGGCHEGTVKAKQKTWRVYFVKRQIKYFVIFYNLLWKNWNKKGIVCFIL